MFRISPLIIFLIFFSLCCVTVQMYVFSKDLYLSPDLASKKASAADLAQRYFHGEPTALLNWCEQDYTWPALYWIAEPVNTMTAAPIVLAALLGFYLHSDLIFGKLCPRVCAVTLVCVFILGVGTATFHATLWVSQQVLLDEIPMNAFLWMICISLFWRREVRAAAGGSNAIDSKISNSAQKKKRRRDVSLFAIGLPMQLAVAYMVLQGALLLAFMHDPKSKIFNAVHGFMSVAFTVLFVSVFVTLTRALNEMESEAQSVFGGSAAVSTISSTSSSSSSSSAAAMSKNKKVETRFDRLHVLNTVGVLFFVASVACWIADNAFCPVIEKIAADFGVPRVLLQMHSWWHVLSACGIYFLWCVFTAIMLGNGEAAADVDWRWGCVPFLKTVKSVKSVRTLRTVKKRK